MKKSEARDILFTLVYESEFNPQLSAAEIYDKARESRGFEPFRYIKKGLSDIVTNRDIIAGIIEKRSNGWKVSRIAPVTRAILFVAVYDIVFKSTAFGIAINEAVELAKKYDDEAAVAFINGVLDSIAKDIESIRANEMAVSVPADDSDPAAETVETPDE